MFGIFADLLSYVLLFPESAAIQLNQAPTSFIMTAIFSIHIQANTSSFLQIDYYNPLPGFCFI